MKQVLVKEMMAFGLAALIVGLLFGIVVGGWLYGGPSTDQVKAIYDLGKHERCWNCFQQLGKNVPVGVIRFHADKGCVKEGKPW